MKHGLFATLATFTLVVAGCSRTTEPVAPPPEVAPEPNTPQNVLRRLEWAVDRRDIEAIRELVTADFVSYSQGVDSAGNPTSEIVQRREDLVVWFQQLLVGTPEHPPAAEVSLRFDGNLLPQRDPRPGYVDSLFKTIRTSLEMSVVWQDGTLEETTGHALFFVARGDTVLVPEDLVRRGLKSDRSRWWMTRWDDQTIASEMPMAAGAPSAPEPVGPPR